MTSSGGGVGVPPFSNRKKVMTIDDEEGTYGFLDYDHSNAGGFPPPFWWKIFKKIFNNFVLLK